MTATRARRTLASSRRPAEPVEPVTGCDPCDNGCHCAMGTPGCEHFGCWGTPVDDLADTCAATAAHIDHMLAWAAYRKEMAEYEGRA